MYMAISTERSREKEKIPTVSQYSCLGAFVGKFRLLGPGECIGRGREEGRAEQMKCSVWR